MANGCATSIIVIAFTLLNLCFVYWSFLPVRDFEAELVALNNRIVDAGSDSDRPSNATSDAPSPSGNNSDDAEKNQQQPKSRADDSDSGNASRSEGNRCDFSRGNWVPDSTPPLYTNETCRFIQPNQNCIGNGRPDREYLNWKWKPDECELPALDPHEFLRLMANKKMIFIGDSMARNHMQSLLCALAQVEEPHKLEKPEVIFFEESEKEMRWGFDRHNFTLTHIWSPFLVKFSVGPAPDDRYHVFLDTPDDIWSAKALNYDVAVVSTAYWYYRNSVYHDSTGIVGCNPCVPEDSDNGIQKLDQLDAYRRAYRSVMDYLVSQKFQGLTIARTVTVDHFEHGAWYTGGVCNRTLPFVPGSISVPFMSSRMNRIQKEEVERANAAEGNATPRFSALDVTYSAFMRPDGHPNFFKIQEPGKPRKNDCLHWCLPGPVDMWNQLIFQTLIQHA